MSQPKDNNGQMPVTEESEIEAALQKVLRATGRIVPQTAAEVAQAEDALDEDSVVLPDRLLTPPTGPRPIRPHLDPTKKDTPHTVAAENLARAARHGAEIPKEVADQMRLDRSKAEHQADSDG